MAPSGDDASWFERPVKATGAWSLWFRTGYRCLRVLGRPLAWLTVWRGYGNLVLVHLPGRRSGQDRVVVLGLLRVDERRYLGHPNGDTGWTRNARAAQEITLEDADLPVTSYRPVVLEPGPERDAVVRATFRQHPFPGNVMYRLAAGHVFATGVFFRLEPVPVADE